MRRLVRLAVFCCAIPAVGQAQHTDPTGRMHSADFLPALSTMPTGIPDAPFGGLLSAAPVTSESHCTNWPTAANSHCFYVDRTHRRGTDLLNANGYPDRPRLTIPTSIASSATPVLVVVAGSGYTYSENVTYTLDGSSTAPIYITAESGRPDFTGTADATRFITWDGDYFAVMGFEYTFLRFGFGNDTHHAAFNYHEIHGNSDMSSGAVVTWGRATADTVVYRNYLYDHGPKVPLASEVDVHAAKPSTSAAANSTRMWYINNHVHNVSGDVFQCGSDPADADVETWPSFVYVGANVGHTTGENHTDVKACKDVVISQNDAYDFLQPYGPRDPGACFVTHGLDSSPVGNAPASGQGALRVWFLFNRIHHCRNGIAATGQSSLRIVGNLFYDISIDASDEPFDYTGTTNAGTPIHIRQHSGDPAVVQHNTFFGNSRGISCEVNGSTSEACFIKDNIISSNTGESAGLQWEDGSNDQNSVANNLVEYGSHGMHFANLAGNFYARLGAFNAARGSVVDCSNCLEGDAGFIDAARRNLMLLARSAAIDAASDDRTYFDEFFKLYGMSIQFDFNGNALPNTNADVGAFQLDESSDNSTGPTVIVRDPIRVPAHGSIVAKSASTNVHVNRRALLSDLRR